VTSPPHATDILAMGDALVDVIATCDDDFLTRFDLPKGAMQLLDEAQALALYDAMGTAREMSGGSAANSMAGAAAMGARSRPTSLAPSSPTTCARSAFASKPSRLKTARRPGAASSSSPRTASGR
jgi:hypothetical protein